MIRLSPNLRLDYQDKPPSNMIKNKQEKPIQDHLFAIWNLILLS